MCGKRSVSLAFYTSQEWGISARAHVRIPFPYLGNDWTDCAEIWCEVRDLLAKHFAQVKSGVHLHVRTCYLFSVPRERLDGLRRNLVCGYGSAIYVFHACYEWGTMHVLMCTPLFRILGSTGRTMQKFDVLLNQQTTCFTQAKSGGYLRVRKCN